MTETDKRAAIHSGWEPSTDARTGAIIDPPASNKEGRYRLTAMMRSNADLYRDAGEVPSGIRGATPRLVALDGIGGRPSRGYRKHIRKSKEMRK